MQANQQGFTLIELIVVIVILGILAATALPKFIDLGDDARNAAIQGAAGALSSSAAINYAAYMANSANTNVVKLTTSAGAALTGSMTWDTKFVIATDADCGTVGGATKSVTLSYSGGSDANTATATIVCTG